MIFLGKKLIPHKYISIIAEISCNHEQSIDKAYLLINAAKDAGADAVKIQAYIPDEMTINSASVDFKIKGGPWNGNTLWELYNKTYTPLQWIPYLFEYAKFSKIPMFASVFGEQSLAALEAVDCPAYKIASFELNDTYLIRTVAKIGKPMVLSTGVATQDEVDRAIDIISVENSAYPLVMHCISKYPAKINELQLNKILAYQELYKDVGFSDHTLTSTAAQLAITLGATVIEKHLTLTETSEDSKFSLRPKEFRRFVNDCHDTIKALEIYKEEPDRQFKRSLYVVKDVKQGEKFTKESIRSIRPGYGLDPNKLFDTIDQYASCDLAIGTALKEEHIVWKTK